MYIKQKPVFCVKFALMLRYPVRLGLQSQVDFDVKYEFHPQKLN